MKAGFFISDRSAGVFFMRVCVIGSSPCHYIAHNSAYAALEKHTE